jgi:pimeloyl-ACP methyl ester carboxylesterase
MSYYADWQRDPMPIHTAATDVQEQVIPVSGHWLMEEQSVATVAAVRVFRMAAGGISQLVN